jgi:electron transfer flavoprotein alpha subunit
MLVVDEERCIGCGLCEKGCPYGGIVVNPGERKATVLDACNLCGICIDICTYGALRIERNEEEVEFPSHRGIMIWGEWGKCGGKIRPREVSLELVGKARQLARITMEEVMVVLVGPPDLKDLAESFLHHGAARVFCLEHELLMRYSSDGYAAAIIPLIEKIKPSKLLLGATPNGRDLAPKIAARLGVGLTADCTELTVGDGGELIQTRPAFGGNIMASIISPRTRPQMATVRPRIFRKLERDPSRSGEIVKIAVRLEPGCIRTRVVEECEDNGDSFSIEEAEVLVSIGRGIGRRENIEMIKALARELGGALSSSRALVEIGWMSQTRQVGQSGRTVSPRLYLALGISGAVQHLVGMSSSDIVIAVNNDPEAPIFGVSDFGIVGDIEEVVPSLLKALKEAREKGWTSD